MVAKMKVGWFLWPALCCVLFASSDVAAFINQPTGRRINLSSLPVSASKQRNSDNPLSVIVDGQPGQDSATDCTVSRRMVDDAGVNEMWFEVDLGKQYFIYSGRLTPAGDCCDLGAFAVLVANEEASVHHHKWTSNSTAWLGAICAYSVHNLDRRGSWNFECNSPMVGRYLIVQTHPQSRRRTMTLCGLFVRGEEVPDDFQGEVQAVDIEWASGFNIPLSEQEGYVP